MKLEVGKSYLTRDGRIIYIDKQIHLARYPFIGKIDNLNYGWLESGQYYRTVEDHNLDLIEEVNMFKIETPTPEISEAVQKYLFSLGYDWEYPEMKGKINITSLNNLVIDEARGYIHSTGEPEKYPTYLLSNIKPFEKSLMIGEYKVEFGRDTIKVGCQVITKEVVNEIHRRLNET